ncbi:MAG: hypothetical protein LAT63_06565 [Marinobacter sp.]|nr:hypothetical protein [Marinobacter sp.]
MRFTLPTFSVLLLVILMLAGCDIGTDALQRAGERPNSFPPAKNPVDDFSESSTGDSSSSVGLARNEIRLTVELPTGEVLDGEPTRRNLLIVTPDAVDVYRVDQSLNITGNIPFSLRNEPNGRVVIQFPNGQPQGPDVVIEAQVGGTRVRTLAVDSDRDIKANPFSEYLVSQGLASYSSTQFQQVMDCVNASEDELCINRFLWSALADQVHDFEIDIPDNLNLDQAVDFLAQRADFASYIADMMNLALLDQAAASKVTATSVDFNTLFFAVELGQDFAVSGTSNPGQWGVRSGREQRLEDANGVTFLYPGLSLATFSIFGINVTSLASESPYDRMTLSQPAVDHFFYRGTSDWARNTHASAPGGAIVNSETRLQAGRSLYQSITDRGSAAITGWTRNPYFLDAQLGGGSEEPDYLLHGYFTAGKAIRLEQASTGLGRRQTLEDINLSALEINLLRSRSNAPFQLNTLAGKAYNLVAFDLRLSGAVGSNPMEVGAQVGTWIASGDQNLINISQTLDSYRLIRNADGAVAREVTPEASDTRVLTHRIATINNNQINIGRLNLDITEPAEPGAQPAVGIGAATPDGNLLAFNLRNPGEGLLIALPQGTSAPSSGIWRLQGLVITQGETLNRLQHLQGASLTIQDGNGDLSLRGIQIDHEIAAEIVSAPSSWVAPSRFMSYQQPGGSRVRFSDGELVLEGYVSSDQTLMILRLTDADPLAETESVGLLVGYRL